MDVREARVGLGVAIISLPENQPRIANQAF